jgi:hypothetical protein
MLSLTTFARYHTKNMTKNRTIRGSKDFVTDVGSLFILRVIYEFHIFIFHIFLFCIFKKKLHKNYIRMLTS